MKIGFDNEKYQKIQSEHIKERISQFDGKLYLELGGKLFDDHHASRVLPGFLPDSKLRMFQKISDSIEIVIVISAADIEKNKKRADLGITYDEDVLRLRGEFQNLGFMVGSVVITHYNGQPAAIQFKQRLERDGIKTYCHYLIEGYPHDVKLIASDEGFGKNDFVETERPLVIVTAPGPGSGKMAVCLSQLYNENKRGVRAGYAKFETFPVWNLPLKHPVNIAYEAATADLNDVNMIDPFHLEAYNKIAINYNRDIEIYPVLNALFEGIYGSNPYKSPTDMGVNMVGFCISDDEACCEASKNEIVRRYYEATNKLARGACNEAEISKIQMLFNQAHINTDFRRTTTAAKACLQKTGHTSSAIELEDGTIITGNSSELLGCSAALLLNVMKHLAGILIVSNPPYICVNEAEHMEQNVINHEPHTALFVPNADPLRFYHALAQGAAQTLTKGGALLTEINRAFAHETADAFAQAGLQDAEVRRDVFGNERMVGAFAGL